MEGLLNYLDEQVDAVRTHAAAALEAFDEKAVHQARVATRRLKAGLDLLEPLLDKSHKPLARAAKQLRRRLGPLRDLDVMIELIAAQQNAPPSSEAAAWLAEVLAGARRDARLHDHDHGSKAAKLMTKLDGWWAIRHKLQADFAAIEPLLMAALHERFADFAMQADLVSGRVASPADAEPLDVHEVRIQGKALRYTLEMAVAAGVKMPAKVMKAFKAMQKSLGDWHDYVVLYERTLGLMIENELALHTPELAAPSLDLAKRFLNRGGAALSKFRAQWMTAGTDLASALAERAPLLSEPPAVEISQSGSESEAAFGESETVSESETDRDPPPTESSEPSELVPEAFEPPTPG